MRTWKEKTWTERVSDSLSHFYISLIEHNNKLLPGGGLGNPQAMGVGFNNAFYKQPFYCNCVHPHDRFIWVDCSNGDHGEMCSNCRGIVNKQTLEQNEPSTQRAES